MREECAKFGALVNVVIPRPAASAEAERPAGLGKVFLHYSDLAGSAKARMALHGRKFGGNPVVAVFYPEALFLEGQYGA